MTPEQRAARVWKDAASAWHTANAVGAIAQAIRAAVAEEREACAKEVERWRDPDAERSLGLTPGAHAHAKGWNGGLQKAAAIIRARGEGDA